MSLDSTILPKAEHSSEGIDRRRGKRVLHSPSQRWTYRCDGTEIPLNAAPCIQAGDQEKNHTLEVNGYQEAIDFQQESLEKLTDWAEMLFEVEEDEIDE